MLKERIQQLEDVLKKFRHSSGSGHAGLDDVMSNRNDYDNLQHSGDESEDEEDEGGDPHSLDALGNLTLRDEGSSTFHGTLAHTEVSSQSYHIYLQRLIHDRSTCSKAKYDLDLVLRTFLN